MNNNIRVLLVDDQREVRMGLCMTLELEPDMTVVGEAADGAEALAAVVAHRPDVLVLDYEMPGMNGIDVVRALVRDGIDIPAVMLSIHDSAALRATAAQAGAFDYVAKHEPIERLIEAIRRAAESQRVVV